MIPFKKLITFLSSLILFPHILFYLCHPDREKMKMDLTISLTNRYNIFNGGIWAFVYFMLWIPEYRKVFNHRIGFYSLPLRLILPQMSTLYIRTPRKNIGGGICITHGHSTEINAKSIKGNCHFFQNVTVGTRGSIIGPTIGESVTFGTGAVVLGDIIIGDNVNIGANATIVKNIPNSCTVVPSASLIVRINNNKTKIVL